MSLRYGEDIQGSTFSFDVDVMPGKGGDSSLGSTLIPIFFILIIAIIGGAGFYVFKQRGGKLDSIISKEAVSKISESLKLSEEESGSGIECWVCSRDIFEGKAHACGNCGARYHQAGQIRGCDILSVGRCLHCNADSSELVEA